VPPGPLDPGSGRLAFGRGQSPAARGSQPENLPLLWGLFKTLQICQHSRRAPFPDQRKRPGPTALRTKPSRRSEGTCGGACINPKTPQQGALCCPGRARLLVNLTSPCLTNGPGPLTAFRHFVSILGGRTPRSSPGRIQNDQTTWGNRIPPAGAGLPSKKAAHPSPWGPQVRFASSTPKVGAVCGKPPAR